MSDQTFKRTFKIGARDVTITLAQAENGAVVGAIEWNPPLEENDTGEVLTEEDFERYRYRRDQVFAEYCNSLGIPPEQRNLH